MSNGSRIRTGALLVALLMLLALAEGARAGVEYEVTIPTTLGDTTETFWMQIPKHYDPGNPVPLLIGWHQWGGDHLELREATFFDEEADARGWIVVAHQGVGSTHWTNQATQSHVLDVIAWVEERFAVDRARIYMVGASMGGAAGMVFSNNHLDPAGPMVAAAVSFSGIQDCERRFREQGNNVSMIEAFGGTPDDVPSTYHRNSAVFFADSTESMHVNARHLPLLLVFGHGTSDAIWRAHAEDLNRLLSGFCDHVVLRESQQSGHGWACAEESIACDFLAENTLDSDPQRISLNADEDGPCYWADLRMRVCAEGFARCEGFVDPAGASVRFTMIRNVRSADLDLRPFGFPVDGSFRCEWAIEDSGRADLTFAGVAGPPFAVLRDGVPHEDWDYDDATDRLRVGGGGTAIYQILAAATAVDGQSAEDTRHGTAGLPRARILHRGDRTSLSRLLAPFGQWTLVDAQGRRRDGGQNVTADTRLPTGIWWLTGSEPTGGAPWQVLRLIVVP